jgi:DNA-binding CsgD family transcriptional regulator
MDYRGRNLDSLEQVAARFTPDRLAAAAPEEKDAYVRLCRDLAWALLNLDGAKTDYYARQAIQAARPDDFDTVYDMSILIGQCFWSQERYDSARVHYMRAQDSMMAIEARGDTLDQASRKARLWGTLGNFYAMQDSLEQCMFYYGKAGEIFEQRGWLEDGSILYRNMGEIYLDGGEMRKSRQAYDKSLALAQRSGDSLMIAGTLSGLGRWFHENGQTRKALKCLTEADAYYSDHPREESVGRADTLAVMSDSYRLMSRHSRLLAIGLAAILLLGGGALVVYRRLRKARQVLTETSNVLDETIEELRPAARRDGLELTQREKDIVRLLMGGKSTKQIADELCLGYETVLWYRKRLHAKLDVHSAAELVAEVVKRNLLD